ncbi:hypothetical protein IW144_001326 [Coemansia sp. RSA 522]|nr:hypothetical protein IW144_001326 [Coemansia sp. RSA 522]
MGARNRREYDKVVARKEQCEVDDAPGYAHKSPISSNQEVSGYDGRDTGDLWTVECSQEKWMRETPVVFKHVDTSKYLLSLPNKKFGQPISGHQEVCAGKNADSNAQWMALEGYYFSRRLNEAK